MKRKNVVYSKVNGCASMTLVHSVGFPKYSHIRRHTQTQKAERRKETTL